MEAGKGHMSRLDEAPATVRAGGRPPLRIEHEPKQGGRFYGVQIQTRNDVSDAHSLWADARLASGA